MISKSQQTVTLKPGSEEGKDAIIFSRHQSGHNNLNDGDHPDFNAMAWTMGGDPNTIRSLIEFDLSFLLYPNQIVSAELSLFYNPNSNMLAEHSQLDGPNSTYIQRITEPWDEFTVTWENQPTTTSQNQVSVPAITSNNQDFIDIDVTEIIKDIVADPSTGHGLFFRIESELFYRGVVFASSDHPNASLHPELKIVYNENSSIDENSFDDVNIFPNPSLGEVIISGVDIDSELFIYDSSGKLISKQIIDGYPPDQPHLA